MGSGNVSTTATYPGTRVVVHCHVGSRINNVYQEIALTCNATGQWLPSNVTCKRMTIPVLLPPLCITAENDAYFWGHARIFVLARNSAQELTFSY